MRDVIGLMNNSASIQLSFFSSYLSYIKLSTAIHRNESMASALQKALLRQPQAEEDGKRNPRPQDLIRLYDIILQVRQSWAVAAL